MVCSNVEYPHVIKNLIWAKVRFPNFCCVKKTRDYESVNRAHSMNSPPKMAAIMNKWICARAILQ